MGVNALLGTAVATILSAVALVIWAIVVEMALTVPNAVSTRQAATSEVEGSGNSGSSGELVLSTTTHRVQDGEMERRFKAEFHAIFMPSAEFMDDALAQESDHTLDSIWRGEYL